MKLSNLRKRVIRKGRAYRKLRAIYIRRKRRLADRRQIRVRALVWSRKSLGIVERGGNNRGPEVEALIKLGGGRAGEPWCGWAVAAWYKRAGSKAVVWQFGSVRLLYGLSFVPGSRIKRTKDPKPGDVVIFTFDHMGLYEKAINGSTIQTIEANTGSTGAVSDSSNGQDGVKRKRRSRSLVKAYLRVER